MRNVCVAYVAIFLLVTRFRSIKSIRTVLLIRIDYARSLAEVLLKVFLIKT